MSADGTGAAAKAAIAAESANGHAAVNAGAPDWDSEGDAPPADPWFAPGAKVGAPDMGDPDVGGPDGTDGDAGTHAADTATAESDVPPEAIGHAARQAEWFLPTGRAGLLPDSMTVEWDDDAPAGRHAEHDVRVAAAGAPPWAGESAGASAGAPPPWETGPWPGPGALGAAGSGTPGDGQDGSGAAAAGAISAGGAARGGADAGVPPVRGRWPARTVVTAGLIPLVVPGLVVGILSLRQPAGRSDRRASWLAIGASIAWALIIALTIDFTGSAGPACASYPAAVHQAYEKALTDLGQHAPAAVQAADFGTAASLANASAAAAGQIGVRTALFAMANDMAQARADIAAHRPVPGPLRDHLIMDGAAPAGSCAS